MELVTSLCCAPTPDREITAVAMRLNAPDAGDREEARAFWRGWAGSEATLAQWVSLSGAAGVVSTLVGIVGAPAAPVEAVVEACAALARFSKRGGPLRRALAGASAAALPVFLNVLKRVAFVPEATAFAVVDVMLAVLAEAPAPARAKQAAFLSDAWPVIAFIVTQSECCAMASALQTAVLGLGAKLLEASAAAPGAQVAAMLRADGPRTPIAAKMSPGGTLSGSLLSALDAALRRSIARGCVPLGPALAPPHLAALHVLHAAARLGKASLAAVAGAASVELLAALGLLALEPRAAAGARVAALRWLYYASVVM